jgi:hypothetical protein
MCSPVNSTGGLSVWLIFPRTISYLYAVGWPAAWPLIG